MMQEETMRRIGVWAVAAVALAGTLAVAEHAHTN